MVCTKSHKSSKKDLIYSERINHLNKVTFEKKHKECVCFLMEEKEKSDILEAGGWGRGTEPAWEK